VVQQLLGRPPFGLRALTRPWVLRTVVRLARPFIPLPLETYLGVHFTKVGDQTREYMKGFITKGKAAGLPVTALVELQDKLAAASAVTSQRRAS
jgi:2-dehydropantoate 2-reductase